MIIRDTLGDLAPFVQFKKREWKSVTKSVFYVFKIVQMVSNRAMHLIRTSLCSLSKRVLEVDYFYYHFLAYFDIVFINVRNKIYRLSTRHYLK